MVSSRNRPAVEYILPDGIVLRSFRLGIQTDEQQQPPTTSNNKNNKNNNNNHINTANEPPTPLSNMIHIRKTYLSWTETASAGIHGTLLRTLFESACLCVCGRCNQVPIFRCPVFTCPCVGQLVSFCAGSVRVYAVKSNLPCCGHPVWFTQTRTHTPTQSHEEHVDEYVCAHVYPHTHHTHIHTRE